MDTATATETTADDDFHKQPAANLETVRVIAPKFDHEDPFAFKNPIEIEGSAFDKHYREPPTPEEISLAGGYVLYGITYGLMKIAEQVTKLPGWKHDIQPATARPPPLDEEHMARADRVRQAEAEAARATSGGEP